MDDPVWYSTTFPEDRYRLFEGDNRKPYSRILRLLPRAKSPRSGKHFTVDRGALRQGSRVGGLVQLRCRQLVADIDGAGGYVTLERKHGGRATWVGVRTWDALQFQAQGKEPDERIIAISDDRIRQILTTQPDRREDDPPCGLRHQSSQAQARRGSLRMGKVVRLIRKTRGRRIGARWRDVYVRNGRL
jgi:hypothetical protein